MSDGRPFEDVSGKVTGPLDASAWDARWKKADTPWDQGGPAPPLVNAVTRGDLRPPSGVLVPGCGSGHDVRFLAASGFDVMGIDVSHTALQRARELRDAANVKAELVEADLFELPSQGLFSCAFDVVWEHTCFCAIDPSLRERYVDAVADLLRPGGRLFGLFFLIRPETGPPFGATIDEVRHRFSRRFAVDVLRPADDSHPARAGKEAWVAMTRTA
jgi:SAM-dependent methyltransferase